MKAEKKPGQDRDPISAIPAREPEKIEMRAHLLDCALSLFAEKGYTATSVRDVIGAAGVTQPTLYYYFDGKPGLFLELLKSKYESSLKALRETIETVDGTRERLHAIIASSFRYCADDPRVPRLMFQTAYGPPIAEVREHLDRLASERFDLVRNVMENGVISGELTNSSADGLALAFCCLMDQHINVLSRLGDPKSYLTPELADWLTELFFQGAAPRHVRSC